MVNERTEKDEEKSPFNSGHVAPDIQWPPPEYDRERQRQKQPPAAMLRRDTTGGGGGSSRHVKRDSEGYIVRDITTETRAAMLHDAGVPADSDSEGDDDHYDSNSEYESSDSETGGAPPPGCTAAGGSKLSTRPADLRQDWEVTPQFLQWEQRQRALREQGTTVLDASGAAASSSMRNRTLTKETSSRPGDGSNDEAEDTDDDVPLGLSPVDSSNKRRDD